MADLYILAINGEVVAENMKLEFVARVVTALVISGMIENGTDEITIQRVSENDE